VKINSKKVFIFFILIALIVSVIVGIQRFNLENSFKQVEMVISLNNVRELALKERYDENQLLTQLKSKGITGIAIHEDTLESLIFQGKIAFLSTNDLSKIKFTDNLQFLYSSQPSPGEFMIISNDYSLFQRINETFNHYYDEATILQDVFSEGDYCLIGNADEEEILKLGLGFSERDIDKIHKLGFNIVLRPKNSSKLNNSLLSKKLSEIETINKVSSIIFDEEEVLGYPSETMLFETATFLQKNNYPFGIIEFASQKGIQNIADNISELAIRVHSITSEEMEKISLNTASERWVRAAQERNIRIFYLNPFLKTRVPDLIQYNLDYVEKIKNNIIENGFIVDKASLFPPYQIPWIFIYLIGLGVVSAGIMLLIEIFQGIKKYSILLFVILFAFLIVMNIFIGKIFLMKILALASALVFPALAIIKNKKYFTITLTKKSSGLLGMLKNIFFGISWIMLISVAGGMIIGALLTHYKFILAIQLFSGIKVAYIFPLAIVAFYFWWVCRKDKRLLIDDLKNPILFEHALFLFVFLVFGVIYIARSGNFSFLPVLGIEEKMRLLLENILVARPRNKEFLIGYPLISLAIAMNYLDLHYLKIPFIIMGTVAPVTIVNTFCHVHTSIFFSILRTFHGYWLGLIISFFLAFLLFILCRNFMERLNVKSGE